MADYTFEIDNIPFQVKKHSRSKRMTMTIRGDGTVGITLPRFVPIPTAKIFAKKNLDWVKQKLTLVVTKPSLVSPKDVSAVRIKARNLVRDRLEYFNQFYGYSYSRITIRDQKSRWGSCSSSGTLSFNYRLALIPQELADYVVVHELCHLKEMNHSSRFWNLVSRTIPNYRKRRAELKQIHI